MTSLFSHTTAYPHSASRRNIRVVILSKQLYGRLFAQNTDQYPGRGGRDVTHVFTAIYIRTYHFFKHDNAGVRRQVFHRFRVLSRVLLKQLG